MALENTKNLELIFVNNSGAEVTFTIANPKDGLTSAEASACATAILNKNIFTTTGGDLKTFKSADIRQVTETLLV